MRDILGISNSAGTLFLWARISPSLTRRMERLSQIFSEEHQTWPAGENVLAWRMRRAVENIHHRWRMQDVIKKVP